MRYSSGVRFSRAKPTGSFRVLQPSTRRVASHEESLKDARKSAAYWTSAVGSPMEIQERFPSGEWVTVQVVNPRRAGTAHATIKDSPFDPHEATEHMLRPETRFSWLAPGETFRFPGTQVVHTKLSGSWYRDGSSGHRFKTGAGTAVVRVGEPAGGRAHASKRLGPRRGHASVAGEIPSFKISAKAPASMTAAEINRELDKLDAQDSALGRVMIDAGRGHERPSEYLKMTDPLATELRKNFDRRQDLRIEIGHRYGPNAPARLPTGRGFGPRAKSQAPRRGGMGLGRRLGGD